MVRDHDPLLVEEAIQSVLLQNKVLGLKDKLNEAAGNIKGLTATVEDREARINRLERVPRWVRWLFRAV